MIIKKFKNFSLIQQYQGLLLLLAVIIFCFRSDLSAEEKDVPKGAERVVLATLPTVSPDGKRIAFVWAGDIWTASISGGRVQRLTSHLALESTPLFSPHGREIAFISQRTGSGQV